MGHPTFVAQLAMTNWRAASHPGMGSGGWTEPITGQNANLGKYPPQMARPRYVASTNPGKLREFAVAAAAHDSRILPLPGLATIEPPAEDAPTFEDIAREKAIYYSRFLPGEIVLADDSGLEVDALQGAP